MVDDRELIELREAFDSSSVPEKNVALRKAFDRLQTLLSEVEELRHDVGRQMTIANTYVNEVGKLELAMKRVRQWFMGYAANGGSDVAEEIAVIDAALTQTEVP